MLYKIPIVYKILGVFLIFVVPILLLNIGINLWVGDRIRQDLDHSASYEIGATLGKLEEEVRRVADLQGLLYADREFIEISLFGESLSGYEEVTFLRNLQLKLRLLKNASSIVEEVWFITENGKHVINTSQFTEDNRIDRFVPQISDPLLVHDGHNLYLNAFSNAHIGLFTFHIVVQLSPERIRDLLPSFVSYPGGAVVLLHSDANQLIAASEGFEVSEDQIRIMEEKHGSTGRTASVAWSDSRQSTFFAHRYSSYLDSTLGVFIPEKEVLSSMQIYWNWLRIMIASAVIVVLLYAIVVRRIIRIPFQRLINAFRRVEKGDMSVRVLEKSNDEFQYLYHQFNQTVSQLQATLDQVYKMQIETQKAELKQLQYQINPHFLYNSIMIIYRMAKIEDCESIEKLTQHLGNYYNYITRGAADRIPLFKEVEHSRDYMAIQTFRFFHRISWTMEELPEGCAHWSVPRLVLQPIMENVYTHGLKNKTSGGVVRVRYRLDNQLLTISVEDNGEETTDVEIDRLNRMLQVADREKESTGLLNVHRRLQLTFGEECGIRLFRSELGGVRVEMTVSGKEREEHVSITDRG